MGKRILNPATQQYIFSVNFVCLFGNLQKELGYMSCCCFKDQVIREQAEEIQRLKALLKENKAEHARSDQILKSRLAAQASLAQKQHSSVFTL